MTFEELKQCINDANWFSNLGKFPENPSVIALKDLKVWGGRIPIEFGLELDSAIGTTWEDRIADNIIRLPTQNGEPDPIHGLSLQIMAKELGVEDTRRKLSLEAYKLTLASLRKINENPLLWAGPTNFNFSARNAAAYAMRVAASEIVVGKESFWCSLIPIFVGGNWPCGYMPSKELVVF